MEQRTTPRSDLQCVCKYFSVIALSKYIINHEINVAKEIGVHVCQVAQQLRSLEKLLIQTNQNYFFKGENRTVPIWAAVLRCAGGPGFPTLLISTVDADAVRHWTVQGSGLVVVLGGEALLEPVVEMETPRGCGLAQLVKSAQ